MPKKKNLAVDENFDGVCSLGVQCTGMKDDLEKGYLQITLRVTDGQPLQYRTTKSGEMTDTNLITIRANGNAALGQFAQALIVAAQQIEKYLTEE